MIHVHSPQRPNIIRHIHPYPIYQGPAIQQLNLTWNLGFSLLDDDEMKNGEIGVDDATSDTPAVTLSGATRTIAAVLSAEQKADSSVSQDALHHGKACCKDSTGNESTMRDTVWRSISGYTYTKAVSLLRQGETFYMYDICAPAVTTRYITLINETITEISLPNIFIFRSKMSTSESTSDISPYVSLGRLRFVQKLLDANKKDKNQSSFDAIFCATGEDSDYNDGCQDLVGF